MDNIQVFTNLEFGEIRVVMIDDKIWFIGKDVAKILGYINQNRDIIRHVDENDRIMMDETQYQNSIKFDYKQIGQRGGWLINEGGLYSLIFGSKLPSAKKFKRWVTNEVLPSIRNHGAYMTEQTIQKALSEPDFLIQLATKLKDEQEKRKIAEQQVKEKQIIIDNVIDDKSLFAIGTVGKILKSYCSEMGTKKIFDFLRKEKILMDAKDTQRHNLPYDKYNKYFEIKCVDNHYGTHTKTYFNGKGLKWFLDKLVKEGYLIAEQKGEVENKLQN